MITKILRVGFIKRLNPDYALGTQIAHKFLIFAVLALRIRTIFCDFRKKTSVDYQRIATSRRLEIL